MNVDIQALVEFENALNPAFPEKSGIEPEILGYGEISTTFSLPSMPNVAFKRMPPFETIDQIEAYKKSVGKYCSQLSDLFGICVSEYAFFDILNRHEEHILYVAQPRLPEASIGNNILKTGGIQDVEIMINALIKRFFRIHRYNETNQENASIGIDGQLSNWSFQISGTQMSDPVYFDITTPLHRLNGKELLDTEIFLKSCPSFLVWLVRWQFLDEVLDRYHDMRMVLIDMVANFHKEGRQELVDDALSIINSHISDNDMVSHIPVLTKSEIDSYYKNDAFIWSLFLSLRRFDRFMKTKLLGRRYNFILPGKISR